MSELKKQYYDMNSWGISASIDLKNCNSDFIHKKGKVIEFVDLLCDYLKVTKYGECQVVHFGEDYRVKGFSFVQLIESSLISGHLVDKTNDSYIDIFSCKFFDPNKAGEFCNRILNAQTYKVNYHFRK